MRIFLPIAGMMMAFAAGATALEIVPMLKPVKEGKNNTASMPVKKTVAPIPRDMESAETLHRLDSVVGFNSDGTKGSLQRFVYNDKGWWTETHCYYWNQELRSWGEPVQSIIVDRMDNGYVLSERNLNSGYGVRSDYEYDDKNRGILMISYSLNPGDEEWTPTGKGEYVYDERDNIIEETVYYYDTLSGGWVTQNHNFATWDSKGRQTSIDSFFWNGTDWERSAKLEYRWFDGPYDPDYIPGTEKERLTYRLEYMQFKGEWLPIFITENEFNEDGRCCSQSYKFYNREFDNYYGGDNYDGMLYLCNSWKSKIGYDELGIQNESRTFQYVPGPEEKMFELGYCSYEREDLENGDFILLVTNQNHIYDEDGNSTATEIIDKCWYAYNASGKKLWCYDEMPSYDGSLIPMLEDKWSYDERGNQTGTVSYDFKDGVRTPSTWVTMMYDEDGNQIELIGRENAAGGLTPFGKVSRSGGSLTDRDYRIGEDDERENWKFSSRWVFGWENGVQTYKYGYIWNEDVWQNNQGQNNYFDFSVPLEEMMVPEAYVDPYKIDYIEQLYGSGEDWVSTRMQYYYTEVVAAVDGISPDNFEVRFHDNTVYVYGTDNAKVNIFDISGQNVYSGVASEVSMGHLSKGVYIIKAEAADGKTKAVKAYVR